MGIVKVVAQELVERARVVRVGPNHDWTATVVEPKSGPNDGFELGIQERNSKGSGRSSPNGCQFVSVISRWRSRSTCWILYDQTASSRPVKSVCFP